MQYSPRILIALSAGLLLWVAFTFLRGPTYSLSRADLDAKAKEGTQLSRLPFRDEVALSQSKQTRVRNFSQADIPQRAASDFHGGAETSRHLQNIQTQLQVNRKTLSRVDPGSWTWPRLATPRVSPKRATVFIQGHDPAAPRRLQLWRMQRSGRERIGETTSGGDGVFDFGWLTLPHSGLDLVVTPPFVDPTSVSVFHVSRDHPAAPQARIEIGPEIARARFTPARLGGEFRVLDEQGRLVTTAPAMAQFVSLTLDRSDLSGPLFVEHVLGTGARSPILRFYDPVQSLELGQDLNTAGDPLEY